jgi:hypothetical protein
MSLFSENRRQSLPRRAYYASRSLCKAGGGLPSLHSGSTPARPTDGDKPGTRSPPLRRRPSIGEAGWSRHHFAQPRPFRGKRAQAANTPSVAPYLLITEQPGILSPKQSLRDRGAKSQVQKMRSRSVRADPPWHARPGGPEMVAQSAKPSGISFCDRETRRKTTGPEGPCGPLTAIWFARWASGEAQAADRISKQASHAA